MREQFFIRHRDRFGSWSYTPVDQSDAKKTTDFAARIAELNQGATAVAFLRRNGELFGLDCPSAPWPRNVRPFSGKPGWQGA